VIEYANAESLAPYSFVAEVAVIVIGRLAIVIVFVTDVAAS